MSEETVQRLSPCEAADLLLNECRMVLVAGLWGVLPRVLLARDRATRVGREGDAPARPAT